MGRFINGDGCLCANDDHTAYDLYTYCGNCPVDRYDVSGLFWKKLWNGFKKAVRKVLNKSNKIMVSIGINTAAIGAKILDMECVDGIYHAKFDCWQQHFGYNDFYDFVFDIGTSMESDQWYFSYNNKKYVFWAWKGNYINLGAGAELGIYHGGGPHWKVDKGLAMEMSMSLKYKGKEIISYKEKTWWLTGFNPKREYLDVTANQLSVKFTVKFNNKDMYYSFCDTCKNKNYTAKENTLTIEFSF